MSNQDGGNGEKGQAIVLKPVPTGIIIWLSCLAGVDVTTVYFNTDLWMRHTCGHAIVRRR